jgi:hypothetical protein
MRWAMLLVSVGWKGPCEVQQRNWWEECGVFVSTILRFEALICLSGDSACICLEAQAVDLSCATSRSIARSRGSLDVTPGMAAAADEFQEQDSQHLHRQPGRQQTIESSTTMFSMPSLILLVFVIQLAIHLISTFGGQAINDLVYIYSCPNKTDSNTDHSLAMAPLHQTPRTAVQTSRRRCNPPQRSCPTKP